ncbi:MAG: BrnT family toxin [Lachnospiraceae bacterium]|nr:BrnT family toxin [Lachnospiraceae bacterium]
MIGNARYIWDNEKDNSNYEKHGLHFSVAKRIFEDVNRIEMYDDKHSFYEDRYITIGYVNRVIVVVYTERKNLIRIISARKATKREEQLYYDNI